ncbi:MAG: signal recognition particle protein, partial [Firmicutes bacterium]|nr:signal recognition particle protein [Bacillota bacterium]
KAQEAIDEEEAKDITKRVMSKNFNLEDFLVSMQQVKKMGSMSSLLGMLPGVGSKLKDVDIDDKALTRVEAMIYSMTPEERRKPQLLNASRKRRIVKGSGTSIQELNRLLKQFEQSKTMMKQLNGMKGKRRGLFGGKNPFGF